HLLVIGDILLVSASVALTGQLQSDFYLLYFLIIMIAAVSDKIASVVWSAALVALVYLCLAFLDEGIRAFVHTHVLIRIPFFFLVAVFYGHLTQLVRTEQSEKEAYKEKLSMAGRLRKLSTTLAMSLDRKTILRILVDAEQKLTGAKSAAVVSRGSTSVLARTGEGSFLPIESNRGIFFSELERRIELLSKDGSRASVSACIDMPLRSGGRMERLAGTAVRRILLPVGGNHDSDLYLVLCGTFTEEAIDYARVLLVSASMSLHNAGQYQALTNEVETRQQVARQLTEALEFKSEFLANITHELRTPLYSFIGFGELLLNGGYGAVSSEQSHVIERMIQNSQDLLELINNILELSKAEANQLKLNFHEGSLETFIVGITDTCMPLLRDKPVSLSLDVESQIPMVVTDWLLMRQISMNLISNAVKFTHRGEVRVGLAYNRAAEQIELSIRDTGVGIPPDKFEEIFEAFR
ncbi:MAG: HAMP domain-containing histidine kinase, partial [Bdellovibrionales bacterium]|nr:HAMP domain-containing histidine kinase [Bdellovibrionales bacterium]